MGIEVVLPSLTSVTWETNGGETVSQLRTRNLLKVGMPLGTMQSLDAIVRLAHERLCTVSYSVMVSGKPSISTVVLWDTEPP
jgi:hypothetical protein